MDNLDVMLNVVQILLIILVLVIYKKVKGAPANGAGKHFLHKWDREAFNRQGIEILNGAVANDTVYTILRSGTLSDDLSQAFKKFHKLESSKIVVIVPNKEVFISNFDNSLKGCFSEICENAACNSVRALLLEPRNSEETNRMAGYLFVSDGHNHEDDDGFYAASAYSKKFILDYLKALINTGQKVDVPG